MKEWRLSKCDRSDLNTWIELFYIFADFSRSELLINMYKVFFFFFIAPLKGEARWKKRTEVSVEGYPLGLVTSAGQRLALIQSLWSCKIRYKRAGKGAGQKAICWACSVSFYTGPSCAWLLWHLWICFPPFLLTAPLAQRSVTLHIGNATRFKGMLNLSMWCIQGTFEGTFHSSF